MLISWLNKRTSGTITPSTHSPEKVHETDIICFPSQQKFQKCYESLLSQNKEVDTDFVKETARGLGKYFNNSCYKPSEIQFVINNNVDEYSTKHNKPRHTENDQREIKNVFHTVLAYRSDIKR